MRVFHPLFVLLVLLLVVSCGQIPTPIPRQDQLPTSSAYPELPQTPVTTKGPTLPWPTETPNPSPTSPPTFPPTVAQPAPTPLAAFPTPAFPEAPAGSPPAELGLIWYPYKHDSDSLPILQGVLIDELGQVWGESGSSFPLGSNSSLGGGGRRYLCFP